MTEEFDAQNKRVLPQGKQDDGSKSGGYRVAFEIAAAQIEDAVSHAFESLRRVVVELHPVGSSGEGASVAADRWGSASNEGSPRWHLRHTVEVFRIHARAASHGHLTWDAGSAADGQAHRMGPASDCGSLRSAAESLTFADDVPPAELVFVLERDVARFVEWLRLLPLDAWARPVTYGRELRLTEMLGIMTRHIVWHAAMIRAGLRDGR
ncbi:MAG: DinB family protein [Planctomycetota bacterium]